MRKVLIAALAVVVAGGIAAGAVAWVNADGGEGPSQTVALTAADSGREIEVQEGAVLEITLESNVTTGFKWQLAPGLDESVLEQVEQAYLAPEEVEGEEPVMGAGGQEVWTFEAVGKGKAALGLEYSQPWEGGIKGDKSFELTVIVE